MTAAATSYLTKEQLREVCARSDVMGGLWVAHCWGVIIAAWALAAAFPNPLTYLLAIMAVGSRQLGLAILMHDGAHGILMKSTRANAIVTQWLCAYPIVIDAWSYRPYHLQHHRLTQTKDDPDLPLSAPFPISRQSFWRKSVRDLVGLTGLRLRLYQIKMLAGPKGTPLGERLKRLDAGLRGPLLVNGAIFALLWAFGHPWMFLWLWIVPLLTWYQWVLRIRNIAEHACVTDDGDVLRHARTTLANPIERFFLAPYAVNYHTLHHMIWYIPCYRLEKGHAYLGENGYHPRMEIQPSYLALLRLATSDPVDARRGSRSFTADYVDSFNRTAGGK